jgi:mycothiol synthase
MTAALRVPRDEDASLVARLLSENWQDPMDEDTVRLAWTAPKVDRELDARLDEAGYGLVERLDEKRVWIELGGSPSWALLDWAEERAAQMGRRILSGASASDPTIGAALEERGFRLVRHSYRMTVGLEGALPQPEWPDEVEVRSFETGDERALYELQQETFEDVWEHVPLSFDEWSHWLLQPPRFVPELWFLAVADGEPVAYAICHPHAGNPELGWIGILGVRRTWRRRGLGRAVLLHAFHAFRARGLRQAGLGVDAESLTGAHRLYESAGMRETARFDVYEKNLE